MKSEEINKKVQWLDEMLTKVANECHGRLNTLEVKANLMRVVKPFLDEHAKEYGSLIEVEADPNDPFKINVYLPKPPHWEEDIPINVTTRENSSIG